MTVKTKRYKVIRVVPSCGWNGCLKDATWGIEEDRGEWGKVTLSLDPMCKEHADEMLAGWDDE